MGIAFILNHAAGVFITIPIAVLATEDGVARVRAQSGLLIPILDNEIIDQVA